MTRTTAEIRRAVTELIARRKSAAESQDKLIVCLISYCRQSRGKSVEVAAALDISKQYLNDILHGNRAISDQIADKLAELE